MLTSARTAVIPLCSLLENENINSNSCRPRPGAVLREAAAARKATMRSRCARRPRSDSTRRRGQAVLGRVAVALGRCTRHRSALEERTGTLTLSRVYIYSGECLSVVNVYVCNVFLKEI